MRSFINRNYEVVSIVLIVLSLVPVYLTMILEYSSLFWILALLLLVSSVYILIRFKRKKSLDEKSIYALSTSDLFKNHLINNGLSNLPIHEFYDGININDIAKILFHSLGDVYSNEQIKDRINEAREYAYTKKYASPREDDEKLMILKGYDNWKSYFYSALSEIGVEDLNNKVVLNVGIGNANESVGIYNEVSNITGVDISSKALEYAKNVIPQLNTVVNSAENLKDISTQSIDLYVSFRTFQSSFFDRRASVHEAYRVLKSGGKLLISIPDMYVSSDGKVTHGLAENNSSRINDSLAKNIAKEIESLLKLFEFRYFRVLHNSPYEIYILGVK